MLPNLFIEPGIDSTIASIEAIQVDQGFLHDVWDFTGGVIGGGLSSLGHGLQMVADAIEGWRIPLISPAVSAVISFTGGVSEGIALTVENIDMIFTKEGAAGLGALLFGRDPETGEWFTGEVYGDTWSAMAAAFAGSGNYTRLVRDADGRMVEDTTYARGLGVAAFNVFSTLIGVGAVSNGFRAGASAARTARLSGIGRTRSLLRGVNDGARQIIPNLGDDLTSLGRGVASSPGRFARFMSEMPSRLVTGPRAITNGLGRIGDDLARVAGDTQSFRNVLDDALPDLKDLSPQALIDMSLDDLYKMFPNDMNSATRANLVRNFNRTRSGYTRMTALSREMDGLRSLQRISSDMEIFTTGQRLGMTGLRNARAVADASVKIFGSVREGVSARVTRVLDGLRNARNRFTGAARQGWDNIVDRLRGMSGVNFDEFNRTVAALYVDNADFARIIDDLNLDDAARATSSADDVARAVNRVDVGQREALLAKDIRSFGRDIISHEFDELGNLARHDLIVEYAQKNNLRIITDAEDFNNVFGSVNPMHARANSLGENIGVFYNNDSIAFATRRSGADWNLVSRVDDTARVASSVEDVARVAASVDTFDQARVDLLRSNAAELNELVNLRRQIVSMESVNPNNSRLVNWKNNFNARKENLIRAGLDDVDNIIADMIDNNMNVTRYIERRHPRPNVGNETATVSTSAPESVVPAVDDPARVASTVDDPARVASTVDDPARAARLAENLSENTDVALGQEFINNLNNPEWLNRQPPHTVALLREGFIPEHRIVAGNREFFISRPVVNRDRLYSIMYTRADDGTMLSRFMYRSKSDGVWRVTPGIEGPILSKGRIFRREYHYTQTTKPLEEISNFMDSRYRGEITEGLQVVESLDLLDKLMRARINIEAGLMEDGLNSAHLFRSEVTNTRLQNMYTNPNLTAGRVGRDITRQNVIDITSNLPEGFVPDFTQSPQRTVTGRFHTMIDGDITLERYPARYNNRPIEWEMARTVDGRVWINRIEFTDSPVNTYGLRSETLDTGILTSKPFEYDTQFHAVDEFGISPERIDGSYYDITPFLDEMMPIRSYRESRNISRTSNLNPELEASGVLSAIDDTDTVRSVASGTDEIADITRATTSLDEAVSPAFDNAEAGARYNELVVLRRQIQDYERVGSTEAVAALRNIYDQDIARLSQITGVSTEILAENVSRTVRGLDGSTTVVADATRAANTIDDVSRTVNRSERISAPRITKMPEFRRLFNERMTGNKVNLYSEKYVYEITKIDSGFRVVKNHRNHTQVARNQPVFTTDNQLFNSLREDFKNGRIAFDDIFAPANEVASTGGELVRVATNAPDSLLAVRMSDVTTGELATIAKNEQSSLVRVLGNTENALDTIPVSTVVDNVETALVRFEPQFSTALVALDSGNVAPVVDAIVDSVRQTNSGRAAQILMAAVLASTLVRATRREPDLIQVQNRVFAALNVDMPRERTPERDNTPIGYIDSVLDISTIDSVYDPTSTLVSRLEGPPYRAPRYTQLNPILPADLTNLDVRVSTAGDPILMRDANGQRVSSVASGADFKLTGRMINFRMRANSNEGSPYMRYFEVQDSAGNAVGYLAGSYLSKS